MIPPTWMIDELRRREQEQERERRERPQLHIELEVPAWNDREPKPERRPGDAIVIEY